MSRRYRRYNRYKKSRNYRSGPSLGEIMGLFLIASILFRQYWYIFLAVAVIAGIIFFVIRSRKSNSEPDSPESQQQAPTQCPESPLSEDTSRQTYSSKDSIMTDCERSFFDALTKILGSAYIIQPQINLASVINKDVHSRYQNELFRNIDFGIFDKNYLLKLLIEINV